MNNKLLYSIALFIAIAILPSCKKEDNSGNGLSDKINAIVSQDIINNLQNRGMTINTGNTPPNIEGIVISSPYTLMSPYGADDSYYVGKVIADYKYHFYNQDVDEIKLDYKSNSGDAGSGYASYLAGKDNKFTLFTQLSGTQFGIAYKHVAIISGEIGITGIKNFQFAFILTEKTGDDANAVLIPVGKGRIWFDGDYIAEATSTYRSLENGGIGKSGLSGLK